MNVIYVISGKRPISAASSSAPSSAKRARGSDDDEEEEVTFVADKLDDIDSSNIIPRSKRRAALASGLVRATSASSSSAPKNPAVSQFDSDDEEADF